MKRTAVLIIVSLTVASFTPMSGEGIQFENGADDVVVKLEPPLYEEIVCITIQKGFYASHATMFLTGMESETNVSGYPERVGVGINGTELWEFRNTGYGPLGGQDTFLTDREYAEIAFGTSGGSSGALVRLPKDAVVKRAMMELSSGPKLLEQTIVNSSGHDSGDRLGRSVSGAGDMNGDGFDDMIVGVPRANANGSNSGAVYIYFGGKVLNNAPDMVLVGEHASDQFGNSVSAAGDLNGDGYDDVVVGAPRYKIGGLDAGAAYIFFGGPLVDDQPDVVLIGLDDARFGTSVSGAGDVNNDGFDDILVGAPLKDLVETGVGFASLFYGGATMDNLADISFYGYGKGNHFGSSVSVAGDVNADGYDDILISADRAGDNGGYAGKVYLFEGGRIMDNEPDLVFGGTDNYEVLGYSINGAGDVNGDGYDDVIIAAAKYDDAFPGAARIFFGGPDMDNVTDVVLPKINTGDEMGVNSWEMHRSVGCAGDVNRDGFDDVVVGGYADNSAGNEAGAAFVFFGGSRMDANPDMTMYGAAAGDYFGYSVSGAGDVNGDGYDEVIIGAPRNDTPAQDAGAAYVFTLVNTTVWGLQDPSLTVGSKTVWNRTGLFPFNEPERCADFSTALNAYLRSAAVSGTDGFGNRYVDVLLVAYSKNEGALRLSNLSIVYDCDFTVGDFSAPLNSYLKDHQADQGPDGNISVPVTVSSTSPGRVRLFGIDLSPDLPPEQFKDIPGLSLDEDTASVTFIDLYDYFKDDVDPSAGLGFSIASATNGTFVRLWITGDRYLSADAMTGDANDNWTGTVEAVVACTDHWGQITLSRPFTITVRNVNDAPVIVSEPVLEARTGVPYYYNASAVDGDNDPLVFSLSEAPANMSIEASSGRIGWVPERKGLYGVMVVAGDGVLSGSQSFKIYVPNSAPRIMDATVPEALVGVPWNFTVPAVDDDGDALAFSILAGMANMTIDSGTGTLNWTPPEPGNFTVTVGVSDDEANVSRDFVIAVVQGNRVPVFTSEPARNATVGLPYVYEAKASDPDLDAVAFSIVSGPTGMAIDGSTGLLNWTPAAAGNFTVMLLAADGKGGEGFQGFTVNVEPKILPTVNIATPSEGQKVRGEITVTGNVTRGTLDVVKVQVRVDSGGWTDVSGNGTWQYALDTKGLTNGRHVLQARAFDGQDFSEPVNRMLVVDNPVSVNDGSHVWYWAGLVLAVILVASALAARRLLRARK